MNSRSSERTLAGLQTGMAGALVMLAWMAISMLWTRHSVWWFPNLMATTFGGDPALHTGFGKYSAAGLALHLLIYSGLGVVFAFLVPDRPTQGRLLLSGVLLALAFYFFMYGYFWKHLNPLIPLYSPDRQLLVAHVFYGMMLSRYSRYAQSAGWARQ
jgi:hypothetical protein